MQDPGKITGILLAAGEGKRMNSPLPKVLHSIDGVSMLERVTRVLQEIRVGHIAWVLGPDPAPFARVMEENPSISVCIQEVRNGTASAVGACQDLLLGAGKVPYASHRLLRGIPIESESVLICNGDMPGVTVADLEAFLVRVEAAKADLGLLGFRPPSPTGYGRILCETGGSFSRIVEEKDASAEEKRETLCNSGIIWGKTHVLFSLLAQVENRNAQQEYYLPDCFALGKQAGYGIEVVEAVDWRPFQGVNTPEQLEEMRLYLSSKFHEKG